MKANKTYVFITLLLPIQILLVQFLSQKDDWIEHYYSNGIYPYISKILRSIFGWLPFSFGDALGIFLIIVILKNVYQLIKNKFKNWFQTLFKCTAFLSILYGCFYFFWALNYFRKPLATNLGLTQAKYSNEELLATTSKIIEALNACQFKITNNDTIKVTVPYTQKQMYKRAIESYQNIEKVYPQLRYQTPSIKSSLISLLQSYNGTAGYLNPITGEAQVNSMIPKTGYPATICHEMAHQVGWSAENDANFVGFLAASSNSDLYFKYSAYRMAFSYCMGEIKKRDTLHLKLLWKKVNKGISKDFNGSYLFWKHYENPIEPYLKKGYNSYLKANKQAQGIESYNYVVDLLIAYDRKIGL